MRAHGFLQDVRRPFAKKYMRSKQNFKVLQVEGKTWPVLRLASLDSCRSGRGKPQFAEGNSLSIGDVCVFESVNHAQMLLKLFIYRAAMLDSRWPYLKWSFPKFVLTYKSHEPCCSPDKLKSAHYCRKKTISTDQQSYLYIWSLCTITRWNSDIKCTLNIQFFFKKKERKSDHPSQTVTWWPKEPKIHSTIAMI